MKDIEFEINDIAVGNSKAWHDVHEQVMTRWKAFGSNENDCPPEIPLDEQFEQWRDRELQRDLIREWKILMDWIARHGCHLQENGKVVLLPSSTWAVKTVNPEAPYNGDALKRNEKIGGLLTQLLKTQTEPLVLAINGAWGSGKTTLLNMWIPVVEKQFSLIHFNAWETDYAKDPLIALVAELKETLGDAVPNGKMQDFVRVVANVTLKGVSGGLLSASDFSPDAMKASSQKSTEQLLAAYEGTRNLLDTFRRNLADIAAGLDNKPLVFVIDELDRCRPTYAIELLERMKHLFTVKGVCFVLALDKKQLGESIKAVYGNIHTEGYLRRFVDLTYNLPAANPRDYINSLLQETHLVDYLKARSSQDGAVDWIQNTVSYLAGVLEFSLRDIEHVVRQISLAARSTTDRKILSPLILTVLACIKYYDESVYHELCQGKIGADDVLKALQPLQKDATGEDGQINVEAALRYIDQTHAWNEWLQATEKKDAASMLEEQAPDQLRYMIKHIQSLHRSVGTAKTDGLLKYLYEKLELIEPLIG